MLAAVPAHAVVVRGRVLSPLGQPLAGARVQLIQGPRSVADGVSGPDGSFEIRSALGGSFLLLTSPSILATDYAPQISQPFYGGPANVVRVDVTLNHAGLTPQQSAEPTLLETPLAQLATPTTQVAQDELLTDWTPLPELRAAPGTRIVQPGEDGMPAYLFLRGAPPATVLTTVNGVTANPLGRAFDFSNLSASGFDAVSGAPAMEVTPTAQPVDLLNASGGAAAFHSADSSALRPTLVYTGDAGTLNALHNEVLASDTRGRFDLLGGFARFDTANDLPATPYHLVMWTANVGYHISGSTSLRVVFRDDLSAGGLASPYEIFRVAPAGRDAHQNLFGAGIFETRTGRGWHNLVHYGLARTREQTFDYATPLTGLPVTLTGANGSTASGTAAFLALPPREDQVTNRDQIGWQSDYAWKPWLRAAGEFRYEDDHAADILTGSLGLTKTTLERREVGGGGSLQGEFLHRVFYEASGSIDHTSVFGFSGNPRLGLTYVPVLPGRRRLRGTSLHATASSGTRELSLLEQQDNPAARIQPRARTLDLSVDQRILGEKLTLRGTYFHSQFSHEFEPVGIEPGTQHPVFSQTLALRTQGFEGEVRWQPFQRVLFAGGYTYLAALTEQSAEPATFNPVFPTIAIGALSALAGQRPFERPPQSGFFAVEYSGRKLNAALKGALSSKSDSSTELIQTPALLLPNRNLSPAYAALDAHLSYQLTRKIALVSQLANLTDARRIAPFGYLSTPFLARAGLRIQLGGE